MRILYIGCVKSSERFLRAIFLQTKAEIVGVVTKLSSNFNADHVSLSTFCNENSLDWIDYENNNQLISYIKQKKPDIIYCFGWSYLLPKEVYMLPTQGAVGYHPTLLPLNRGRHPIIWTIALGLKNTGSTFFYLEEKADSGAILSQRKIALSNSEDANSLYEKLLVEGEEQVIEMTYRLMKGSIIPQVQDESKATYWRKRSKIDGEIDWRMSANSITQLIRALTRPYMGAHFTFNDHDIIVWKAKIIEEYKANIEPGKILSIEEDSFIIKTGDMLLEVLEYEGNFKPKVGQYL